MMVSLLSARSVAPAAGTDGGRRMTEAIETAGRGRSRRRRNEYLKKRVFLAEFVPKLQPPASERIERKL